MVKKTGKMIKKSGKITKKPGMMTKAEESLAIARYHYGEQKTLTNISKYYIKKDVRVLSKIMKEGRGKWWNLTVSPEIEFKNIRLNKDKAEQLKSYLGFNHFIVVECLDIKDACNEKYREKDQKIQEEAAVASDMLHVQLAMATANHLSGKFRPQDKIGLASGRAVTYTSYFLYRHPDKFEGLKNAVDTELFALSGGQYDFRWSRNSNTALDILPVNLDASNAVSYLALALRTSLKKAHLVTWPISCADESMKKLFPPHLKAYPPQLDIAVLGLGVVNTRHHYYSHPEGLEPIQKDLQKLGQLQEDNPRLFNSIVEICHYLFVSGQHENIREVKEITNSINDKIVSIDRKTLRNTKETIIIAGGAQKARALASFSQMYDPNFPIELRRTTLITDSWTADEIIKIVDNELKTEKKQRDRKLTVKS